MSHAAQIKSLENVQCLKPNMVEGPLRTLVKFVSGITGVQRRPLARGVFGKVLLFEQAAVLLQVSDHSPRDRATVVGLAAAFGDQAQRSGQLRLPHPRSGRWGLSTRIPLF